jgi:hypothetical protein
LWVGSLVYILWRGFPFFDPSCQFFPLFSKQNVSPWLLYQLPDALWLYSFLHSLYLIWGHRLVVPISILGLAFSFTLEIGQIKSFGLMPGTFDYYDLLFYTAAAFLFIFQHWTKNSFSAIKTSLPISLFINLLYTLASASIFGASFYLS